MILNGSIKNKGKTLDKRLAKQREREKGERIKALDQASGSSEREIMTAKQNAGLTNWFLASQAKRKNIRIAMIIVMPLMKNVEPR